MNLKDSFRRIARQIADWTGSVHAFSLAALSIAVWALTGPIFHFSENWQLVINTTTNIVTFLMVFAIQNAQSRDSKVLHLKIDELIRTSKAARVEMLNLDEHTDEELESLHAEFIEFKKSTLTRIEAIRDARQVRRV